MRIDTQFLLHVSNLIAFRRVPRRRAVGKNTTVFVSRANQYMSCFEHVSLMWLNRTVGVGRHTGVIPEAPGLEPWGVVTDEHILAHVRSAFRRASSLPILIFQRRRPIALAIVAHL